jgi:transposase
MRETLAAGEKLFVDYAGDKVAVVVNRLTGEIRDAHIFVAVLGASTRSYAEASWTDTLPDWIASHVRVMEAIGGTPAGLERLSTALNRCRIFLWFDS